MSLSSSTATTSTNPISSSSSTIPSSSSSITTTSSAKASKKAQKERIAAIELTRQARRKQALWSTDGKPRNILSTLAALFLKFDRNGIETDIFFTAPEDPTWTPEIAKWIFDLTKHNMEQLYNDAPDWGWKDSKKRSEINDPDSRYIIVKNRTDGELVAFASFRFLMEGVFDVLYVYELQLTATVQRKGLGKHLMQMMELVAKQCGMQMVMLTVLKNNKAAFDFYISKMKYTIDMTSPSMSNESAGHEILSKIVDKPAVEAIEKMVREGV